MTARESAIAPRSEKSVSDPKNQGADKPLLKPVGVGSFVRPAASERPALIAESYLLFVPLLELDGLDAGLLPTGFEGVDAPASEVEPDAPDFAASPESPISPPRPILEVRPSATPIAVYEPIEFLDYDDEDDSFGSVTVDVEPEPETEPEPPVSTQFAFVTEPQAAAPVPAKPHDGFAHVTLPDAPVEIPDLVLSTVRPRILRGPNPYLPKPKPTPTVVQRPAAAAPEKDKRAAKPAPTLNRPVRDRGNAVPVEEVIPEPPAPLPKPKMVPIRKPEPLAPAAAVADVPMLGFSQGEKSSRSTIAIVAAVVVTLGVGGYFVFSGSKTSAEASSTESTAMPGMVIGGGGWTSTWGADAPTNKGKQISIYRPSMTMPDYRFEFRGQIERKALGWIFRASNPKNYYVMKLETIKPGANPMVALVKYAVIDGKETTRTQVMLPSEVKVDTVYQVRLDVSGDKFTTYVQGKLVDYWTDNRIKLGGAGFYSRRVSGRKSNRHRFPT